MTKIITGAKKLIKPNKKHITIINPNNTILKTKDEILAGVRYIPVQAGIKTDPLDTPYTHGAEGMIRWVEDYIYVSITPPGEYIEKWILIRDLPATLDKKTGKCYSDIWEHQKNILREALAVDERGEFIHRLIVLCWMRGEGKSLLACLIQLWKFFCFKRQKIMLGANSKDQVKFVHYDIMREIILNSPSLKKFVGERNIQEKEIKIVDKKTGANESLIRSISSFSGIVSNITGYTFSEMFDMKKSKFFVQLDGSIRNMTNAFGVIDSTVSSKTHVLYDLYEKNRLKKTKTVYFSHRSSEKADVGDYWNPKMDADQLADYEIKFPFGEFERYFKNTWSAGIQELFTYDMIQEIQYLGMAGGLLNHLEMNKKLKEKQKHIEQRSNMKKGGLTDKHLSHVILKINHALDSFKKVSSIYELHDSYNNPRMCGLEELQNLGDLFDTNWAILAGADMGDPLSINGQARTIFSVIAKGLPGSRSNPLVGTNTDIAPRYLYIMMHLINIPDHSLEVMKTEADLVNSELLGIDKMCTERYGSWDMVNWCSEQDIEHESAFPNYERQKDAFKQFFTVCKEGRFKSPEIKIMGSKTDNVFTEELAAFDHNLEKKKFGSPEKFEVGGIQDDVIYAIAWTIYGGRNLGVDDFRQRKGDLFFGEFIPEKNLIADYT